MLVIIDVIISPPELHNTHVHTYTRTHVHMYAIHYTKYRNTSISIQTCEMDTHKYTYFYVKQHYFSAIVDIQFQLITVINVSYFMTLRVLFRYNSITIAGTKRRLIKLRLQS